MNRQLNKNVFCNENNFRDCETTLVFCVPVSICLLFPLTAGRLCRVIHWIWFSVAESEIFWHAVSSFKISAEKLSGYECTLALCCSLQCRESLRCLWIICLAQLTNLSWLLHPKTPIATTIVRDCSPHMLGVRSTLNCSQVAQLWQSVLNNGLYIVPVNYLDQHYFRS